VLIIREKAGERSAVRIDLNQKDVFNSPYFYMQQNDIIYVEPDNKVKVAQTAPGNRYVGIWAAVISVIGFTAITFIRETN
jgi:polysaccharide export outer membrane protein